MRPLLRLALSLLAAGPIGAQSPFDTFVEPLPVSSNGALLALAGDLDGDGLDDLVTLAAQPDISRVYLARDNGALSESPATQPFALDVHRDGALLDVDSDGDLDLFLSGLQVPSLYLNQGGGDFVVSPTPLPTLPQFINNRVEAADVDGDGDQDLWLGTSAFDALLLSDGAGGFTNAATTHTVQVASSTGAVAFVDLDGVNGPDLVLGSDVGLSQLRVHLNDGSGRFLNPQTPLPMLARYREVRGGDLDGDGDQDLVVASSGAAGQELAVALNLGAGTFAPPSFLTAAGTEVRELELDDFDGDGDVDIVASIGGVGEELWLNDGSASFVLAAPQPALRHPLDAFDMTPGDWNGDGRTDLAFARGDQRDTLVFNLGGGAFLDDVARMPGRIGGRPAGSAALDLDGDGALDIALLERDGGPRVYRNDGSEHFVDETATRLPALSQAFGWRIHALDVDADADADLFVLNEGGGGVPSRMLINDGTGVFTDGAATWMPGFSPSFPMSAVGDVDADGDDDVVVFRVGIGYVLLRSNGTAFMQCTACFSSHTTAAMTDMELVDLDGDQDLDLLFADGNGLGLYTNDGAGSFTLAAGAIPSVTFFPFDIAVGDVDGNASPDIVATSPGMAHVVLQNLGNGTFVDQTSSWWPAAVDRVNDVVLADFDLDGRNDLVVARGNAPSPGPLPNLVFLADATGRFLGPGVPVDEDYVQVSLELLVADFDEDSDPDLVTFDDGAPARLDLSTRFQGAFRGSPWSFRTSDIELYGDANLPAFLLISFAQVPPRLPIPPFGVLKLGLNALTFGNPVLDPTGRATVPVQMAVVPGATLFWQPVYVLASAQIFQIGNLEVTAVQ